jgi:rsbT co-antagonist protein RsbR
MSVEDYPGVPDLPSLTDSQLEAMRSFWKVYDAHYEEVRDKIDEDLAGIPEISDLLDRTSSEQSRLSRELGRRAILDGEWQEYLEYMQDQGESYARTNLSFGTWVEIVGAFRKHLFPLLVSEYGEDSDTLVAAVDGVDRFVDVTLAVVGEAYLSAKERTISEQQDAIRELSTPVLQLREGLLILPIVGLMDSYRARQLTESLLAAISRNRARVAVIDITGVPAVDSRVANNLVQTVEAARLMGATVIVTGLSPEIAQTLVTLGIDLSIMNTVGDLQGGIDEADRIIGYRVIKEEPPLFDVRGS